METGIGNHLRRASHLETPSKPVTLYDLQLACGVKKEPEVPQDVSAFYGHPLTAANQSDNGDTLALLHEYQSLYSIEKIENFREPPVSLSRSPSDFIQEIDESCLSVMLPTSPITKDDDFLTTSTGDSQNMDCGSPTNFNCTTTEVDCGKEEQDLVTNKSDLLEMPDDPTFSSYQNDDSLNLNSLSTDANHAGGDWQNNFPNITENNNSVSKISLEKTPSTENMIDDKSSKHFYSSFKNEVTNEAQNPIPSQSEEILAENANNCNSAQPEQLKSSISFSESLSQTSTTENGIPNTNCATKKRKSNGQQRKKKSRNGTWMNGDAFIPSQNTFEAAADPANCSSNFEITDASRPTSFSPSSLLVSEPNCVSASSSHPASFLPDIDHFLKKQQLFSNAKERNTISNISQNNFQSQDSYEKQQVLNDIQQTLLQCHNVYQPHPMGNLNQQNFTKDCPPLNNSPLLISRPESSTSQNVNNYYQSYPMPPLAEIPQSLMTSQLHNTTTPRMCKIGSVRSLATTSTAFNHGNYNTGQIMAAIDMTANRAMPPIASRGRARKPKRKLNKLPPNLRLPGLLNDGIYPNFSAEEYIETDFMRKEMSVYYTEDDFNSVNNPVPRQLGAMRSIPQTGKTFDGINRSGNHKESWNQLVYTDQRSNNQNGNGIVRGYQGNSGLSPSQRNLQVATDASRFIEAYNSATVSGVSQTSNSQKSAIPSLPFPLPAVPPGFRLVITHHPIPTETEPEPKHITQLIIDNPNTPKIENNTLCQQPSTLPVSFPNHTSSQPIQSPRVMTSRPRTLDFTQTVPYDVSSHKSLPVHFLENNMLKRSVVNTAQLNPYPSIKTETESVVLPQLNIKQSPCDYNVFLNSMSEVRDLPKNSGSNPKMSKNPVRTEEDILEQSIKEANLFNTMQFRNNPIDSSGISKQAFSLQTPILLPDATKKKKVPTATLR